MSKLETKRKINSKTKTEEYIALKSYMKTYDEPRLILGFERQIRTEGGKELIAIGQPIQVVLNDTMVLVGNPNDQKSQGAKKEVEGLYSESEESDKFINKIVEEYILPII